MILDIHCSVLMHFIDQGYFLLSETYLPSTEIQRISSFATFDLCIIIFTQRLEKKHSTFIKEKNPDCH